MILEVAVLSTKPGTAAAFEAAMAEARRVIAASPGFRSIEVRRGIDTPESVLLLVGWDSVEDHMVGFRESPRFAEWRALLQPFFAGAPRVEHYAAPLG